MPRTTRIEYAVRVRNRGWLGPEEGGRPGVKLYDTPKLYDDKEKAYTIFRQAEHMYEALGCNDIAKTLEVLERTVQTDVVTFDWSLFGDADGPLHTANVKGWRYA